MGLDRIGTKLNPCMAFGTNFLFQSEPVIRNPNDKELKYFQLFWAGGADNTRWKKSPVRSDPCFPGFQGRRKQHGAAGAAIYGGHFIILSLVKIVSSKLST